jgi:ubiquitin C-terminal hydrolase
MQNNTIIAPETFKEIVGKKNEFFSGFEQNDSHELLNFILDTIHEETKLAVEISNVNFPKEYHAMNKIVKDVREHINNTYNLDEKLDIMNTYNKYVSQHQNEVVIYNGLLYCAKYIESNSSISSKYFTGVYHSTVECGKCKNKSHSFECFTSSSLEIPKSDIVSLYDCLNLFTSSETLKMEDEKHDNRYNCSRCGELTDSKKTIVYWHIPTVLFVHLKRFKVEQNKLTRINTVVNFPFELNMNDYVCQYNKMRLHYMYELVGVIQHFGSMRGGHYISIHKSNDGFWYVFDDSNIGRCKHENIEMQLITPASYVLVYIRKH